MGLKAVKRPLHPLTETSPFHALAQFSSAQPLLSLRSSAPHLSITSTTITSTTLSAFANYFTESLHRGSSSVRGVRALVHRAFSIFQSPRLLQSAASLLIIYHRWRRKTIITICPIQISTNIRPRVLLLYRRSFTIPRAITIIPHHPRPSVPRLTPPKALVFE